MVQDIWLREPHPSRLTHWEAERPPPERPDGGRPRDVDGIRRPPVGIQKALREQCRIPVKHYFVAVILDDGKFATFAGPGQVPDTAASKFFQKDKWIRAVTRHGSATSSSIEDSEYGYDGDYSRHPANSDYTNRRAYDRRPDQDLDALDEEGFNYKTRKRPRAQLSRREVEPMDELDAPIPITASKKGIKIGNTNEVWEFYGQRFRNCQQTACKMIAKAWVKAVEPKKQSTHPYTGKDETAPGWWPKPWGAAMDDRVRHKEPDHLYKKERVYLLTHILRLIVEPNPNQHPDIRKLFLNVAKLEEVTMEALSTFFNDKDNRNNAKKKLYLKEIFKVARMEERYKNGEIDGDHEVYVMADDKIPDGYLSENEESGQAKDEGDADPNSGKSSASPQRRTATHGILPAASTDHSPSGNLQGDPFNLPVRGPPYQPQILPPDLGASDPHGYVEGANMAVGGQPPPLHPTGNVPMQDICPPPPDPGRRPSVFSAPADFVPSPAAGIYSSWQQSTTAPSNSPMYSFTTHQQSQQGPFVSQGAVPMAQNQAYMGSTFDGLPRAAYDPNQGSMFRHGSVPQNAVPSQPAYATYMHGDGRGLANAGMKIESLGRSHI